MLNFAVGPVMMNSEVRAVGAEQIPYFRTKEFSALMLENEQNARTLMGAPDDARVIFMTGSGTASMEAAVMNTLDRTDRALVVDGGSFGHRFCEICRIHGVPYTPIVCESGKTLTAEQLAPYEGAGYTAFLVNLGETSTGVLYDLSLIADFCRRNRLFLIVDAISSFLCDPLDMRAAGANVVITGSQKALATAPGVSLICCDRTAQERINRAEVPSLYFGLRAYLSDGERGQTPFTPAVGILLQLHARFAQIMRDGGVHSEVERARERALYFRRRLRELALPLRLFADLPSNAVTSLSLTNGGVSAYAVFETLKDEYDMFVCPNGGALRDRVFRVGHMGDLTLADYDRLLGALSALAAQGGL